MTTLAIDDELGRLITRAAQAQGRSVGDFVNEALRQASASATVSIGSRSGVPVFETTGALPIDPADIRRELEEQGF